VEVLRNFDADKEGFGYAWQNRQDSL
jgi:hypothetical protein